MKSCATAFIARPFLSEAALFFMIWSPSCSKKSSSNISRNLASFNACRSYPMFFETSDSSSIPQSASLSEVRHFWLSLSFLADPGKWMFLSACSKGQRLFFSSISSGMNSSICQICAACFCHLRISF